MTDLSGVWIWLHDLSQCDGGAYDAIASRCHAAGVRGLFVKAFDGAAWYPQTQPGRAGIVSVTEMVQEFSKRGLAVATWSYNYGADVADEAQRTIETLQEAQPVAHIWDIEIEWETAPNSAARAQQLVSTVQAAVPTAPLVCCSFSNPRSHTAEPYYQMLVQAGMPFVPMNYFVYQGWGAAQTIDITAQDLQTYGLGGVPVWPAYADCPGDNHPAAVADVQAFCDAVKAQGWTGVSVWDYQNMNAASWANAALAAQAFAPAPPPQPTPPVMTNSDVVETLRRLLPAGGLDPAAADAYLKQFMG